jgi:hypothetical protein
MELLIGVIVWGGLLWLVVVWLARPSRAGTAPPAHATERRQSPPSDRSVPRTPQRALPGTPPPGIRDETQLEDEALVDGLIIGYHLARQHHEERVAELRDELEALQAEVDPWLLDGGDTTDDVVALEEALEEAELDAYDTFGLDPWDDGFDDGDGDH